MRSSCTLSRLFCLASFALFACSIGHAQEVHDGNNTGFPPFGSFHGSDFDLVSLQNGNLHIQIPVASIPQRAGRVFHYAFLYDTPSWEINNTVTDPRQPASWLVSPAPGEVAKWRLSVPGLWSVNYEISQKQCSYNSGFNQVTYDLYTGWTVTDANGTKHPFALRYESSPLATACTDGDLGYGNQLKGTALDGSGIILDATNNPPYGWVITLKDGTHTETIDTNGNAINGNADWLGRQDLTLAAFSTYQTWTVTDSNGSPQQFRVDYSSIPIQTSLCGTLTNCTEYTSTWNLPAKLTLPTGKFYQFTWAQNGNGDLQRVDLPTGGYISYGYSTLTYSVLIHAGKKKNARRAVSSRTVYDGQVTNVWTYTGACGGNVIHGPLGNEEVHVFSYLTESSTTLASYETQVLTYQGTCSTGKLLRTVTKDYLGENGPFEPAGSDGNGYDYGLINARVIRETTTLDDGQVSKVETDFETFSSTFLGTPYTSTRLNVTEKREFAYGAGSAGALLRRTDNTYLHTNNTTYQNLNILDRVTSTIVYDGASHIAAQTQTEYDNYTQTIQSTNAINHNSAYGSSYLTRGNVTAAKRWRNTDGAWLTTRNQYDDVGNVISTTDPLNHTTSFDFTDAWGNATCTPTSGSARGYLKSRTNALGQATTFTHNSCTGTIASTTDPNNLVTTLSYDLMNRPVATNFPDGGQATTCYTDMGGATCTPAPAPFNIVTTKKINTATSLTTVALTDALARVKQTQLTSDPQGTVYTDTTYDALGRVASVSNPYRLGSDPTTTTGTTTYGYDGLGRKTSENYPDGSVLITAYCGASTLVTDPTGKWRRSRSDALGRLVEVDEPNAPGASVNSNGCPGTGEPIWVTSYTYDTLGNLTNVLQNGSHARTFTFDSLSRLLTSNNPEVGVITYKYDSDTNCTSPNSFPTLLVSKTDARGIRTCAQYDALNRQTVLNYSNGDSTIATTYDQSACLGLSACQNVGQRTSRTDAAGSEAWSYQVDATNNRSVHVNQRTTNSITKTSTYYLDLADNVTQAVYPTGRVVNYAFDAANRPKTAVDGSNGITYATDFQSVPAGCLSGTVCYTPQGTFYALSIGQSSSFTGLNLTHTYNNRLQPNEFKASSTGGNAIDISYNFVDSSTSKNAGHVYGITNNLDSTRSQTFTYDQLNRITSALTTSTHATSSAHCWGETYTLDPWANLNSIAATTNSAYTGCSQESGFSATADGNNHLPSWAYDASGNATSDGVVTNYLWNAESELKSAAGVTYTYDGDGRRVSKVGSKLYWYGSGGDILAETNTSGTITAEYIFFGGKRIAMIPTGANPIYYVEDMLGTSRVVTTNSGVVCYDADFYPYGGERSYTNTCPQNYKFEGKERDTETGNDDFGTRYYSNRFGRWLSADWSAVPVPVPYANLTNPQTLNLYSMVADDPESFADLDGHQDTKPKPIGELACPTDNGSHAGCRKIGESDNHSNNTDAQQKPDKPNTGLTQAQMKQAMNLALMVFTMGALEAANMGGPSEGTVSNEETVAAETAATTGAETAATRANAIASTYEGVTADKVTVAVTETAEGARLVSSSEPRGLRPAALAALEDGELAVKGPGPHAERTGLNAAKQMGLTPTGVAASRPICQGCWDAMKAVGAVALSVLKHGVLL